MTTPNATSNDFPQPPLTREANPVPLPPPAAHLPVAVTAAIFGSLPTLPTIPTTDAGNPLIGRVQPLGENRL